MSYEVKSKTDVVKPGPMELEQDEKFVCLGGGTPMSSKRTAKEVF